MGFIVVVLLIIVIVFGVSSGLQSQAQIETARAAQETAQAAQVSAWGNLVTILVVALVVLVILGSLIAFAWWKLKHWNQGSTVANKGGERAQLTVNDLVQLEILRTLKSMNAPSTDRTPLLIDEKRDQEQSVGDDPLNWLR